MTPKRGPTKVMVFDDKLTLDPKSKLSILNRSIVIHEKPDDLGKVREAKKLNLSLRT